MNNNDYIELQIKHVKLQSEYIELQKKHLNTLNEFGYLLTKYNFYLDNLLQIAYLCREISQSFMLWKVTKHFWEIYTLATSVHDQQEED